MTLLGTLSAFRMYPSTMLVKGLAKTCAFDMRSQVKRAAYR